jgi:peroxiredoxin
MLGEAAEDRSQALASLRAPDFTLPDITGKLHSLSDFRGKKVFLATWASW